MNPIIVKVRAFGERFWVQIQDILPGLEEPVFRARVDNEVINKHIKVNDIIYITARDIIDIETRAADKQKLLRHAVTTLPSYPQLTRYH